MDAYTPSKEILEKYAQVLVRFALGGGKGIKKGEVVCINGSEVTKPLFIAVRNAVLDAGGHVILNYLPDEDDRYNYSADFFNKAKAHQLDFFPAKYYRGLVDETDHLMFIVGDNNPHALKGVPPAKIMQRGKALKQYRDWRTEKENKGKFTWCIALWGTPAMAKEAGLSIEEYWQQIIDACFLEEKDPIAKWKQVYKEIDVYKNRLNKLSPQIKKLHIVGPDEDLWITLGKNRQWLSGSGRNIPSFEIFTSPDWRGTEGWIRINQPLYRYGTLVKGIELHFKEGRVIKASATEGEKVLKEMIKTLNADKIGEFSLTDRRHSRITKFMAETLFDENVGGPEGNTHIALGMSYVDTYTGNPAKLTQKQKDSLGFNDSAVHTDVISTAPRTVTAHLTNGKEVVIYKSGQFTL